MIKKIKQNIWQLCFRSFGSVVYLVKLKNNNIIIDTGSTLNKDELTTDLKELKINPLKIDILILTHNHWDHTGNIKLFENAKIYANKKEFTQDHIIDINKLKN